MSVQMDKSRLSSTTTMFIPSQTGGHFPRSRTTENCAEHIQSWNSRVSFPPENRLSSESLVCRTMRRDIGRECENVYKNTKVSTSHKNINNRLSSSSSLKSSDTSEQTGNMLEKSVGNLARLFVKSSQQNTDHCSHYNSKFISPSTLEKLSSSSTSPKKLSSSPSSTTHCTMSHNHHHWSSQFGIVLVAILLLSFSSTTVLCVPLGNVQQNGIGGGGDDPTSSKLLEYSRKLNSQQGQQPVSISQSNRQPMYLPFSLQTNDEDGSNMEKDEIVMKNNNLYHTSIPTQTNYHQLLKKTAIQKPISNHKDIPRSIHLTDDPEMEDSDEMDNEILPPSQNSGQFGRARHETNDDPILSGQSNDEDEDDDLNAEGATDQDNGQWETVIDPHLYLLTEWGNPNAAVAATKNNGKYTSMDLQPRRQLLQRQGQFSMFRQQRKRRNSGSGPSLSIVNPLDVLRQRLLLEIARRRMRQSHNQIIANEEILRKIGRR